MGRRDTPGNLRLLTPQSKSCQITSEPKVYEEVKLRHNNMILPEGVGVAVALIAPLLPAQSGSHAGQTLVLRMCSYKSPALLLPGDSFPNLLLPEFKEKGKRQ